MKHFKSEFKIELRLRSLSGQINISTYNYELLPLDLGVKVRDIIWAHQSCLVRLINFVTDSEGMKNSAYNNELYYLDFGTVWTFFDFQVIIGKQILGPSSFSVSNLKGYILKFLCY